MALPKAVQRQVDDVNKLVESMKAPPEEGQQPEGQQAEEEEQTEGQQAVGEGEEQHAAGEEQHAEGEEQPKNDEQTWEQRYRVLQGKYNSEVPRLSRDLRTAQEQITGLQHLLANLQHKQAESQQPSKEIQAAAQSLVRPEEIEEYGDEFLDLVGRRAQEVASPLVNKLNERIRKLEAQLTGVSTEVAKSAKDKVIDQLDRRVKNWKVMNEDEGFLNWLDMPDAYSGQKRGKLLNEAFEKGDAERVIAFFNGYLTEHAAVQGGTEASGDKPAGTARVPMNELVAPGKPKAGTAGAQQEKRIWTRQEIQQFFSDSTKGKFKNKPEEYNRLYADIVAAGRENRVR